jgi:hypothetical protein
MAKKKPITPPPVIKRSIGKDGRLRFFENGKPISNKKNQASLKFIRQDFRRLTASPTAQQQAKLTEFEKRVLRNTQNSLKGRDKVSDAQKVISDKRYRVKGKFVGRAIQKTIDFNPELRQIFRFNKNINSEQGFENLFTKQQILNKLADLIDLQRQRISPPKSPSGELLSSAIIDNNDWINIDREPRTEKDFSGTFNKSVEVLDIMQEINAQMDKTRPPSVLKVINRSGIELFGEQARRELERFVAETTKAQFDKDEEQRAVAVKFFFPYKVIYPDKGAPELIIDLNRFNEDDDDYFQFQTSEMPVTQKRSA